MQKGAVYERRTVTGTLCVFGNSYYVTFLREEVATNQIFPFLFGDIEKYAYLCGELINNNIH